MQAFKPATLLKRDPQVFSCAYCEIFKNSFSYRTLPVATSEYKKIKRKWTGFKNNIYFFVMFSNHGQSLISGKETGNWALGTSNQFCGSGFNLI